MEIKFKKKIYNVDYDAIAAKIYDDYIEGDFYKDFAPDVAYQELWEFDNYDFEKWFKPYIHTIEGYDFTEDDKKLLDPLAKILQIKLELIYNKWSKEFFKTYPDIKQFIDCEKVEVNCDNVIFRNIKNFDHFTELIKYIEDNKDLKFRKLVQDWSNIYTLTIDYYSNEDAC